MGALISATLLWLALGGREAAASPEAHRVPRDPAPVQDQGGPDDPWEAARRLPPGLDRARAFRAALEEVAADPEALQPRLDAAFEAFVADHDAFRAEAALTLAEAMHDIARARWSAECLEGICRRTGDYERADAVLAEQLTRTEDPLDRRTLTERSAILAAGAGWRTRERDRLGRALAVGGTDAIQMLGRLALARSERGRALALFRVLVERHPGERSAQAPPWALRGWGLALLPPRSDPLELSTR